VDEFYRHARGKDGRQPYCKTCTKEYVREWEKVNSERLAVSREAKLAIVVDPNTTKTCRNCHLAKPLLAFHRHRGTVDGRATYCKDCALAYDRTVRKKSKLRAHKEWLKIPENRENVRKYLRVYHRKYHLAGYGLTPQMYENMFDAQDGRCALCQTHAVDCMRGILVIDHDHETGKVRALLCGKCNSGLGMFADNPALMRLAAEYVAQHKGGG
jgi:hypothetical protein